MAARVLERDPGNRPVGPAAGDGTVFPVLQEVVVVGGPAARRIREALEFRVRHREAVDIERLHRDQFAVAPAGRVLPGVLNVQADPVESLDFHTGHMEVEFTCRNADHALRHAAGRLGGRDVHDLLQEELPFARIAAERPLRPVAISRSTASRFGH